MDKKENKFVIVQFPNLPLIIMFLAWVVSYFSQGYINLVSRSVFIVAGVIWSYEEIFHGVNWFRRILGGVVMLMIFMDILTGFMHL